MSKVHYIKSKCSLHFSIFQFFFFVLTNTILLTCCTGQQTTISPKDKAKRDSLALRIGVMPTIDCLPIYYASRMNLFEKVGVDVCLVEYLSQMDCDTAVQNNRVHLSYTDIARTLQMPEDIRVVMGMEGRLSLITARTKRIRQLKHLNERMVAIDRLSQTDYWSDELMRLAGLDQAAIYRPQINDVRLRTAMLMEQLVDAALLPEPYATQAQKKGNRRIFEMSDSSLKMACLVMPAKLLRDSVRTKQVELFFAAYDKAVETLNGNDFNRDSLNCILRQQYEMPKDLADSIVLPNFHNAHLPKTADVDKAMLWLQERERVIKTGRRDNLICSKFVSKTK